MNTTTISHAADIARPFASRDRRPPAAAIRCVQVKEFDGGTSVTATDLEVACAVTIRDGIYRPTPAAVLLDRDGAAVAGDFPAGLDAPIRSVGGLAAIDFKHLRRIADHVAVAADNESSRYALGGVLLEMPEGSPHLTAVATDGRRLHAARFAPASAEGFFAGPSAEWCIAPARLFAMTAKAIRAAARAALGLTGRRLDAAVTGEPVVMTCDGREVVIEWSSGCGRVHVRARARLMEGRFPRWRDVVPHRPEAVANEADWSSLAAWCRGVVKANRSAAEAAGDAAAAGSTGGKATADSARKAAIQRHQRGVAFAPGGATACGCDAAVALPAWGSTVTLDPAFVADAADAVAEWGVDATAAVTDQQSAVVISTAGWDRGAPTAVLAVIMPMAAD
jgi:hypothetical protein